MYKLIAIISLFVRNFYLPNPFANLNYGFVINWMIEPLLYLLTYGVVGLFYQSGYAPALGSLLYLFFYSVNICLIMLCSEFEFSKLVIVIAIVLYISLLTALKILKRKIHNY